MVERAGAWVIYLANTSLNSAKSFISCKKQVAFTILSRLLPAASSTALRFSRTRVVCSVAVMPVISPVLGMRGICPDVYTRFPLMMACEYGPIAAGARVVSTFCMIWFTPLIFIVGGILL